MSWVGWVFLSGVGVGSDGMGDSTMGECRTDSGRIDADVGPKKGANLGM